MNPATSKVGNKIVVSHGTFKREDGSRCFGCGCVATVTRVTDRAFAATTECGWKLEGMRTDNYRAA